MFVPKDIPPELMDLVVYLVKILIVNIVIKPLTNVVPVTLNIDPEKNVNVTLENMKSERINVDNVM